MVTLYGRQGCHLCDEARSGLQGLAAEGHRFELRELDIDSDEALHRELLELIPVVEVEGERICELLLDADAIVGRLATVKR